MWSCVKSSSVHIFDHISALDTIPFTNNVQLIRDDSKRNKMFDGLVFVLPFPIIKKCILYYFAYNFSDDGSYLLKKWKYDESKFKNYSWMEQMIKRSIDVFSTHNIRIDLNQPTSKGLFARFQINFSLFNFSLNDYRNRNFCDGIFINSVEPRVRHRVRRSIFPAIFLGMAILGVITIPLGFHLLSMLGGKALVFAKMALLISGMSYIKRVSTQNHVKIH